MPDALFSEGTMAFSSSFHNAAASIEHCKDEELILLVRKGNQQALGVLIQRHKAVVTNFVYRFVGDYDKAVDIAQETFVRVFRFANKYSETARFSTWLLAIAANLAKTELRRVRTRNVVSLYSHSHSGDDPDEWTIPDNTYVPDVSIDKTLVSQRVQKALLAVSPTNREVVILRDMLQLSYEEISMVTGCEMGTVKSRINRGRKRLQEELRDLYEELFL